MRGGNTGYVGKRIRTVTDRKTEMTLFLYGCTDERFADTTVDGLVARYGLGERDCEYALTVAKQKRG